MCGRIVRNSAEGKRKMVFKILLFVSAMLMLAVMIALVVFCITELIHFIREWGGWE